MKNQKFKNLKHQKSKKKAEIIYRKIVNEKDEKRVVIKVDLPKKLKLKFKVLCTHKELTMSNALEELIKKWIQANAYTDNFISEPAREDNEVLKGYIPASLKIDFKILCIQKGITMRSALYNLIERWIITINNQKN